jgi:hypothetical protein
MLETKLFARTEGFTVQVVSALALLRLPIAERHSKTEAT